VIALLAPPPIAVFVAGLLTAVLNLFVHAKASLPGWLERYLRMVFITPDLHRTHHSEDVWEQWQNLGQTFVWWDRLFGTYADQPRARNEIKTGLKGMQNAESLGLGFMLAEPFQEWRQTQTESIPS
jgi:sterol desaturase/sphingolipid hydroxylase (fatty acid hydroxylase superfamily)